MSQAEPTRSISGRGRVSQVRPRYSLDLILLGGGFAALIAFQFTQEHFDILGPGTVEEVGLLNLAKLLPNAID